MRPDTQVLHWARKSTGIAEQHRQRGGPVRQQHWRSGIEETVRRTQEPSLHSDDVVVSFNVCIFVFAERLLFTKNSCTVVQKRRRASSKALQKHHVQKHCLSPQSSNLWPEQRVCAAPGLCPQVQPELSDGAASDGQRLGWVRHNAPAGAERGIPIHLGNNRVSFSSLLRERHTFPQIQMHCCF